MRLWATAGLVSTWWAWTSIRSPKYPFQFVPADAIEYGAAYGCLFDDQQS
ncbi:hypothetical protein [Amycolatopsis sp. CA-230715]|nr:hypothetical protein [Amycolatopsis sp. CA-230715]